MESFRTRNKIRTKKPQLTVAPDLPAGRYQFRLTVVDEQGNRSQPALLNLEIVRGPILDPRLRRPLRTSRPT